MTIALLACALICALSLSFTFGLFIGIESQVRAHRRCEEDWEQLVWHERHRSAALESQAAELRAELTRLKLTMSESISDGEKS